MGIFKKLKDVLWVSEPEEKSVKRTFFNIRCGDILTYLGDDFVVNAVYVYDEEGFKWNTYGYDDSEGNHCYFSVVSDDRLELSLWKEVLTSVDNVGDKIVFEGKNYFQTERGIASVSRQIISGQETRFRVKYWEYEAESGEMLSIEESGGTKTVTTGKMIEDYTIEILPGS
ncbi:DUF4178 domain-containing protein [bacterium]|nr:DUF4178 domain-containing protein [bacterium]